MSPGSLGFAWVHPCAPKCRRVHSCWRGFTGMGLEVVGFMRGRVGSLGHALDRRVPSGYVIHSGAPRVFGFIQVRVGSLGCA